MHLQIDSGNLRLPASRPHAATGYRVPKTNDTLERMGFNEEDRNRLFAAYGKEVLKALAVYLTSEDHPHRVTETIPLPTAQAGLVALLERMTIRDGTTAVNDFLSGQDPIQAMVSRYSGKLPTMKRIHTDEQLISLIAREDLVRKYIWPQATQVQ